MATHHGNGEASEEEVQPDFSRLSPPHRDMLALAEEILRPFEPEPNVMHDLPQLTVQREQVPDLCQAAKNDPRLDFKLLLCMTCVDYEDHCEVVYFLQSLSQEHTLILKTTVPYDDPSVPSVSGIWQAADWYEREAHDLFGVEFDGHPDLAPLLLYDEFEGYPGRKEYPLYEYQEF